MRVLQFFLVAYQRSGCRTVVAVGDIHSRYLLKDAGDTLYHLVVADYPERMTESLRCGYEVVLRLLGRHLPDDLVQVIAVGVGEEDGLYIGIVHAHVLHAVFLLVAAGQLMLLDAPLHIVFHPCSHYQSVLRPSVHRLGIDVVLLFLVLTQPSLLAEHVEMLHGRRIHFLVVLIRTLREVDLGLDDVV